VEHLPEADAYSFEDQADAWTSKKRNLSRTGSGKYLIAQENYISFDLNFFLRLTSDI